MPRLFSCNYSLFRLLLGLMADKAMHTMGKVRMMLLPVVDVVLPDRHPAAREEIADRPRDAHANRGIQNTVERVGHIGIHGRIEQQDAQHDAARLHAADPEHLAKQDQQHRAHKRQRHQPKGVSALRTDKEVEPEEQHAKQAADERAEKAVAAVLLRVLHVRAHAEDRADARKGRAAAHSKIDNRAD